MRYLSRLGNLGFFFWHLLILLEHFPVGIAVSLNEPISTRRLEGDFRDTEQYPATYATSRFARLRNRWEQTNRNPFGSACSHCPISESTNGQKALADTSFPVTLGGVTVTPAATCEDRTIEGDSTLHAIAMRVRWHEGAILPREHGDVVRLLI
ncbi:hypothetical protein FN846DRAFT_956532 [Sphaerosporella brunnea]|uniref:Uncharacterized protein n=1 Tax=Sphaerosporella brunnea TaxID=1250544 RepID=A0A5J5ESK5_9PEZI|nr:hypothetical protein FN846DRAFT_956532 [Sphaerosporella brunnea]